MAKAYEELVDFIAAGATSFDVSRFSASLPVQGAVAALIRKEKTTGLTPEETAELNHYLVLEHILRLAKARAALYLDRQ